MKDEWSEDIERFYDAANRAGGLAHGPWRVIETANAVVPYNGQPGCFKRVNTAYSVTDMNNCVIAVVEHREVAQLLAQMPDLCVPVYRPAVGAVVPDLVTYGDWTVTKPLTVGVADPERVFVHGANAGYQMGFEMGFDEGSDAGDNEEKPDA